MSRTAYTEPQCLYKGALYLLPIYHIPRAPVTRTAVYPHPRLDIMFTGGLGEVNADREALWAG